MRIGLSLAGSCAPCPLWSGVPSSWVAGLAWGLETHGESWQDVLTAAVRGWVASSILDSQPCVAALLPLRSWATSSEALGMP